MGFCRKGKLGFGGRADSQVVTSMICNRSHPFNFGMIAPGNHLDLDSLRAAPPARYRSVALQIGIYRIPCHCEPVRFPGVAIPWLEVLLFVDEFRETAQKGQSV